jgi:16S rRNA (uracil1498-N3)-methyltransferase
MQLFIGKLTDSNDLILTEEETFHCVNVLRKKIGDELSVTDGKGNLYNAIINYISKKNVGLSILDQQFIKKNWNYRLHIAIAPTKNNDRTEWFVEKATEIGVDEISFIICKNSERRILKTDRLIKIAESASKQSLKFNFPIINEATEYKKFIANQSQKKSTTFIAHCRNNNLPFIGLSIEKNINALVFIGPEGDFTEDEIQLAKTINANEISLGTSRLRTETAALSVVHYFSFKDNL